MLGTRDESRAPWSAFAVVSNLWVVIEVAVVDIIGGGSNELLDKREIVGCEIPNASVLNKEYHPHLKKTLLKVKQKTYDALHSFPTAAACDSIIEPSCIAGLIFAKTRDTKPNTLS